MEKHNQFSFSCIRISPIHLWLRYTYAHQIICLIHSKQNRINGPRSTTEPAMHDILIKNRNVGRKRGEGKRTQFWAAEVGHCLLTGDYLTI